MTLGTDFTETGPERSVHNFLEGQPKFSGAPLQEPGEIIVNCECGPHETHHGALKVDVKASSRASRLPSRIAEAEWAARRMSGLNHRFGY